MKNFERWGSNAIKNGATLYLRLAIEVTFRLPTIIIALLLCEWLALTLIREFNIIGIGAHSWMVIDSLAKLIQGAEVTDRYSDWLYGLSAFPTDVKKLIPYVLVFAWSLLVRGNFLRALAATPLRHTLQLATIHLAFSAFLVFLYYSHLYTSYYGHWIGELRIGMFSSWEWLTDMQYLDAPLRSILALSFYRLSYSLNTAIMFFGATVPVVIISACMVRTRPSPRQVTDDDSLFHLAPKNMRDKWRRGSAERDQSVQFGEVILILLVLAAIAVITYKKLFDLRRFESWQVLLLAAVLVLVVVIPGALFVRHRRTLLPSEVAILFSASPLSLMVIWLNIYNASAEILYEATFHKSNKGESIATMQFVGKTCTSLGTSYFESQETVDLARRCWEGMRIEWHHESNYSSDSAACILYWLWTARLHYLSTSCQMPFEPVSLPQLTSEADTAKFLDSVVALPFNDDRINHTFRWARNRKWGECLNSDIKQIHFLGEAIYKDDGKFTQSYGNISKALQSRSVNLAGLASVLVQYALKGTVLAPPPDASAVVNRTVSFITGCESLGVVTAGTLRLCRKLPVTNSSSPPHPGV